MLKTVCGDQPHPRGGPLPGPLRVPPRLEEQAAVRRPQRRGDEGRRGDVRRVRRGTPSLQRVVLPR